MANVEAPCGHVVCQDTAKIERSGEWHLQTEMLESVDRDSWSSVIVVADGAWTTFWSVSQRTRL